jgi:CDGSH-type Zn-finger protein
VRILDGDGTIVFEGEKVALCRCGGSANKPFCDGTHAKNGFSG